MAVGVVTDRLECLTGSEMQSPSAKLKMDSPHSEIESRIRDLCVLLHTELSSLVHPTQQDSTADDSFMSLSSVLSLDTVSALDHIEAAIKELLTAKRQLLNVSQYSAMHEQEQYCQALQKLETEIRGHIQAQHQMALHIELLQQKVEDLEKEKKSLVEEYEALVAKIRAECEELRAKGKEESRKSAKTIQDVQLRKVAKPQTVPSKGKEGSAVLASTRTKPSFFDQAEWDKMYQRLTNAREDTATRESDSSDPHRSKTTKRPQTAALSRELQAILKDIRLARLKDSRSTSPLLSTLKKDATDSKDLKKKLTQRPKSRAKARSVDRLRSSKSSLGLVSSTQQQF